MCDCREGCCGKGATRRDVLKAAALGAAGGGLLAAPAAAAEGHIPPECKQPPGPEWFDTLLQPGEPIVYRGANLRNLIFPLGGIGTGTIWLAGSGRLVNWQIFNNIRKDTGVDDSFFAVRIEVPGKPPVVRALQLEPVGPFPPVAELEFQSQYPIALLTLRDPELPVELTLEAYNPLVPLDERDSGLPCAIFTLQATNKTDQPIGISFMAGLQNAVGHPGRGRSEGVQLSGYGRNVNLDTGREEQIAAVLMKAEVGQPARIDPPVSLLTDHRNLPYIEESPVDGLAVASLGMPKTTAGLKDLYWLARGDLKLIGASTLSMIVEGVRKYGGLLLISGVDNPLAKPLSAMAPPDVTRRETLFASFDDRNYGQWEVDGPALGSGPAKGTAADQNVVSGFSGTGLVNTYQGSDEPKGRLLSPEFTIRERYISFLIGGGSWGGRTCINLLVDGKVVRTAAGANDERLSRTEWDVQGLAEHAARIEIVDDQAGPWGHVLVDDIRFGNLPIDAVTAAEAEGWNSLLQEMGAAAPMTPVGIGAGKAVLVPVEFGALKPDEDIVRQRDRMLTLLAEMAGLKYSPAAGQPRTAPSAGTMCLASPDQGCSVRAVWLDRDELLHRFASTGKVGGPGVPNGRMTPSPAGHTVNAAISRSLSLAPGASAATRFVYTWHFPNQYYPQQSWRPGATSSPLVGNMYDVWFRDARSVLKYVLTELPHLDRRTRAFRRAMFETSLPQYFIDAVAANISIIRSPTCFWTRAGEFYGFEGCNPEGGCCPMNCNHVWNYEHTLARMWPALEVNMRVTELKHHQMDNGGLHHRVSVPRSNPQKGQIAVADGQCGAVLKAWREHLNSPDRRFLSDHWPAIRKAMDFAISEWDKDGDGVMEQPQFNTYDRVIYGQNTFISSWYLAALRAAEEMARMCNETPTAQRYRRLFEAGRKKAAETLFNGEYYIQLADNLNLGYGTGCMADQVIGCWYARVTGLGEILPVEQVRKALQAVFANNFLWRQTGFEGTQRFQQFADGNDKGLLVCTWPKGGRPADPILYRDECWTGVEYQVASHCLYEGQVREGLSIVRGARERYDGSKRSPWNEIECGDYYARALASWSLLLAAQGFSYNGPAGRLGFDPRLKPEDHHSLFTVAAGWGTFSQKREANRQRSELQLLEGRCDLSELRFGLPGGVTALASSAANIGDTKVVFEAAVADSQATLKLAGAMTLLPDQPLVVELSW